MQFTIVSTIFNEAKRLPQTIADLEVQTIQPTEIIITDAGSTDGTWEMLHEWQKRSATPIVLLQENRCSVARGRNLAIAAAKTELIVSTDFGCQFHPQWIESITAPLFNFDTTLEVCGGAFEIIEADVQTLAAKSDYILQRGYPVVMNEFFSVSSRSIAYKKYVWKHIGGYPEWLTLAADDTIFWKLVKKHGFRYQLVDQPYVYWGRHKTNRAFAKEAFRYGLGDGESRINYRNFWSTTIETAIRYFFFTGFILLPVLITYGLLHPLFMVLLLPFTIGLRSYRHAWQGWQCVKSSKYNFPAFVNALWQLELSRIQYIKGYLKGMRDKDVKKAEGRRKLWAVLKG
ncbi:MAG: glycosyltransferase [Breznakibacter sp.]